MYMLHTDNGQENGIRKALINPKEVKNREGKHEKKGKANREPILYANNKGKK